MSVVISGYTLDIRLTQLCGWLCWRRNPPLSQIPQAVRFQLRPQTATEASPVEGLLFFCSLTRLKCDDDADVVDEVLHPLTLLTACSTSGSVTEGVDEMVEAP